MTVELEEFEKIEVNGTEALFTNRRVFESEIPNGLFRYDLRESDETGRFCAIEKNVVVNHGGSVITKTPILSKEKHARWLNLLLKASSENKKKLKEEFYNGKI